MHPKLFEIPFIHLTVPSYGLMMVVGFLLAVWVIRRLSRNITPDPQFITNAALYSLIAGVVGARLFFVVHYFYKFKGDLLSIFAIWRGGVELLGGVLLAITVIFLYLWYHKLPVRRYLDILAIGLMLALSRNVLNASASLTTTPYSLTHRHTGLRPIPIWKGIDVTRSSDCPPSSLVISTKTANGTPT